MNGEWTLNPAHSIQAVCRNRAERQTDLEALPFSGSGLPTCTFNGVSDGARTRDPQDHNLVLYQLSYAHHCRRATRG